MEGRIYSPIGDQYSSDIKVDGFGNYFQLVKDEILADIQRTLNTPYIYGYAAQTPSLETVKIDLSVAEEHITDKYPVGTIVEYGGNDYEVISREDWEADVGEALELEYLPVVRLDVPEDWEDPYDWYDGILECHIGRVVEDAPKLDLNKLLDNWQAVDAHDHSYGRGVYIMQNPPQADSINIEFKVDLPKPGPRKPQPRYGWHG